MKRIVFIISCCLFAVMSASAQTLDQKKICALKWTLQQTFYNKPEGQQIARLNVTEFKSFNEFQQNKLISDAIKKVTNPSDLSRVKNIIGATNDSNLASSVPSGAKREYQADLDKAKSAAPVVEDEEVVEEETEAEPADEPTEAPAPGIQTVEEVQNEQADEEATPEDAQDVAALADAGGVSWLDAVLIALGVYVILSLCVWLFLRSRKHGSMSEEMVSMEQYRAERVRLMERIKSVEIEMENMKDQKQNNAATKANVTPEKPAEPVVKQPEVRAQPDPVQPYVAPKQEERSEVSTQGPSLFSDPVVEPQEVVAEPVVPIVEQPVARPKFSVVMFYPVPEDGMFVNGTTDIEPGKSLYMMKTSDNVHATFQILNTPEAISAALVSMNDMVKPACKVLNTVADPVEILAEKLGTAVREGEGWRITNKAVVRLI
ncbi:MAG: hypothetical protein J5770_03640 [Bacteroidaceae bacterium]|nr:hypothetical protein [Bacteroidaceae bacterium]